MAAKGTSNEGLKNIIVAMALLDQRNAVHEVERKILEVERRRIRQKTAESFDRIEAGLAFVIRVLSEQTRQLERITEALRNFEG